MEFRTIGRIDRAVSVIGFGAWAIGGSWGEVDDSSSYAALLAAYEAGITFFDTADVYGDGRSERLVAKLKKETSGDIFIATKAGRRAEKQSVEAYSPENLTSWIERSRENLETDCLDLVQLHCPPTDLFYHPEVFAALDDLRTAGKIRNYGVSVERVEEGLKALDFPNVVSVQIIYNIFRQRPADRFLDAAHEAGVGVIARVPLASGLLTGKITRDTIFSEDDHRNFNRHGEAFDVGETFAGVDFETGLAVVEELKSLLGDNDSLVHLALRFCYSHPGVTTVIPGAKTPLQATENAKAGELGVLDQDLISRLQSIYREKIAPQVHYRW
ncbi:MAG: aldo/keto reductase [Firmicutes bacterium]|jgi:aryl-alcohol dehydrogenase-like predicted oxidoreductase|nr:aldo/keto reductase [Bacillota bacterium]